MMVQALCVGACLLVALLAFGEFALRRRRAKRDVALKFIFQDFDGAFPSVKESSHYGYPSFTITFASKAELDRAEKEGLVARFIGSIQEIYAKCGTRRNPFSAERAVWATYESDMDEMKALLVKHGDAIKEASDRFRRGESTQNVIRLSDFETDDSEDSDSDCERC